MTSPTVYKSTDASAPVLSGQAGALAGVLDGCLVNGYGAKAAAGWAIPFTGTNTRAYRAATGNRMFLSLDDTVAASSTVVSYETMSAILTGTNPSPTVAQQAAGLKVIKSTTADATARPWMVIANDTFFYLFCYCAQTVATNTATTDSGMMYGDLLSFKSGDAWGTLIAAGIAASGTVSVTGGCSSGSGFVNSVGHYLQRFAIQTGTAGVCAKEYAILTINQQPQAISLDNQAPALPDPISGGINLGEMYICENQGGLSVRRGKVPGMYAFLHNSASLNTAFTNWDTCPGTGAYAGVDFILVRVYSQALTAYAAIQYDGTWA